MTGARAAAVCAAARPARGHGGHFRRLPVVSDVGRIGIASITDACRAAGRTYEIISAIHDRHVARRLERDPAGSTRITICGARSRGMFALPDGVEARDVIRAGHRAPLQVLVQDPPNLLAGHHESMTVQPCNSGMF
jgi:hypothetical protein